MINMQGVKFINSCPPAAIVDNDVFAFTEIDTKGYDYATIICQFGATDVAMAALKVTESDTAGSNHADVTGLVYGTSTLPAEDGGAASVLPTSDHDNTLHAFFISLKGRKRYLDLVVTAGNGSSGTFMSAMTILSRANALPDNASERGLAQNLIL